VFPAFGVTRHTACKGRCPATSDGICQRCVQKYVDAIHIRNSDHTCRGMLCGYVKGWTYAPAGPSCEVISVSSRRFPNGKVPKLTWIARLAVRAPIVARHTPDELLQIPFIARLLTLVHNRGHDGLGAWEEMAVERSGASLELHFSA